MYVNSFYVVAFAIHTRVSCVVVVVIVCVLLLLFVLFPLTERDASPIKLTKLVLI